jgi:hypothetical protein
VLPVAYVASVKVPTELPLESLLAVARPANAEPAGAEVTRTLTVKLSLPPVVYGAVTVIGVTFETPT